MVREPPEAVLLLLAVRVGLLAAVLLLAVLLLAVLLAAVRLLAVRAVLLAAVRLLAVRAELLAAVRFLVAPAGVFVELTESRSFSRSLIRARFVFSAFSRNAFNIFVVSR